MNKLFAPMFGWAAALALASPAVAQERPLGLVGLKIAVADYERATRFYALLGMTAGASYNAMERELKWADPAKGVSIIMVRDSTGRIPMVKSGGFVMISVADVPATVARLKAAGFAVERKAMVTPRATIQMLKDPDGNTVELLGPGGAAAAPAAEPEHDHAH
jgi:predicted enzyme related to lactoylglutathione lyase